MNELRLLRLLRLVLGTLEETIMAVDSIERKLDKFMSTQNQANSTLAEQLQAVIDAAEAGELALEASLGQLKTDVLKSIADLQAWIAAHSATQIDPRTITQLQTVVNRLKPVGDVLAQLDAAAMGADPGATLVGSGTVTGTVTDGSTPNATGVPISGAVVTIGSLSTTTDANGFYSLGGVPSDSPANITVSAVGYTDATTSGVAIADGSVTMVNFGMTKSA